MRIKLGENMPARLVRELGKLGHNVDTVPAEQLASRPDAEIRAAAQRTRRFLITPGDRSLFALIRSAMLSGDDA
jgi:predicted nuclease of predicted toxin-antitoxin system